MSGDNSTSGDLKGRTRRTTATSTMPHPPCRLRNMHSRDRRHMELEVQLGAKGDRGCRAGRISERRKIDACLSRVTNAQPKIANYHFTTLTAESWRGRFGWRQGFVIADIPGLIEGASEGVGLGHEFLRHIERTKVMIHMVDAASTEGRDPVADIKAINKELEALQSGASQKATGHCSQ